MRDVMRLERDPVHLSTAGGRHPKVPENHPGLALTVDGTCTCCEVPTMTLTLTLKDGVQQQFNSILFISIVHSSST